MERRRRSRRNFDRLSALPDKVIDHILSFLPTKLSASTSVLAKRWRFLWAHTPNLHFHGYDFKRKKARSSDIIRTAMMLHRAKIINTISLSDVKGIDDQLEKWITIAVQRGVCNFYVDFVFRDDRMDKTCVFTFPRRLLACKTLVDLKLDCCRGIPSSGKVFLPCLKKLRLRFAQYEDGGALPHLLSGCPVLEELIIEGCYKEKLKDLGCVVVTSQTIKILNVDLLFGCRMLTINAPSLRYLNVKDCCLEHITSSGTMTSLDEAEFTLNGDWNVEKEFDYTQYPQAVEFLNCLYNLKCLKISSDLDDKLADIAGVDSMVKFDNLTKLELDLIFDWHDLVKFLQVADNLEVLIFNLGRDWMVPYREPKQVPICMLSRLRLVRINDFDEHDFDLVRYLLKNAKVLKRMEIYAVSDMEKLDALRKISLFGRGSKACQVAFY